MKCLALLLLCAAASAIPQQPHQPPASPVVHPPVHQHKQQAPAAVTDSAAFFDLCPQGPEWIRYQDSCYKFYETSQYWYLAEQTCKGHGGHLVSIADRLENSFVAKLTYCQSAWTGRYARHVDRLTDPANYNWTDGSTSTQYHAHDFTSISSIHQPLISVDNLLWRNNLYHAKHNYVCKVKTRAGGSPANGCPRDWKHLNGSCYMMPSFNATPLEALYHCRGKNAYLASVYSQEELRALSLLDLGSEGCPPELWIGLIKINPCQPDIFSGEPICYEWEDREQKLYNGFPAWHPGHPDTGEVINCVLLKDRAMKTIECHKKHRFVCKKKATAGVQ